MTGAALALSSGVGHTRQQLKRALSLKATRGTSPALSDCPPVPHLCLPLGLP